jgi:uncharacterized protein with ATP-grasp and redox domains
MLNQAWNTVRIATQTDKYHLEVLKHSARLIDQTNLEISPAVHSKPIYDLVAQVTGINDAYSEFKRKSNEEALRLLPNLQQTVDQAKDRVAAALHAAVAGNIIDLGIGHAYNLKHNVTETLEKSTIAYYNSKCHSFSIHS